MNASTAAPSSRNDHSVALVSLETWEYNSPWVKLSGKKTDAGLLAMALVYYDQVFVELQHPQQLRDIVEWVVRTGHIGQLIGLIKEGILRFHHHAFMTSAVNKDGVFSLWNLQEAETTVDRFMEITVQPADLSVLPARHRSTLLRAIRQHTDLSLADDYGPPIEDARRALHDEATSNALLQAVVDDLYPRRGIHRPPNVACHIEYAAADTWKIFWKPDLGEITRLAGGGLDYRPDIPLIGEALSNRLMWTAVNRQCDLVLGDVMSTVTGRKLAEVGRREGKVGETLYELQATVDLPDMRALGNSDALRFDEVLRVRKHATRFRQWLQERGEKDSPSVIAYLNDVAETSGFRKTGGTTVQMLGYGAELVAAPVFAAALTGAGGAALAVAIGAPVSGEFLKYLGTRINSTWRPIVFGNFLKKELGTRQRD